MEAGNFKKLYRIDEVAEILNCSPRTVYRLVSDRELLAFQIRSSLRVSFDEINRYIQQSIEKSQDEGWFLWQLWQWVPGVFATRRILK